MQKDVLVQQLQTKDFHYRTFYQNLAEKLTRQEITSLNVLGRDFFALIDHVARELLIEHAEDCFLLEMSLQTFSWEVQVFVNQFVRNEAGSVLKLRQYCTIRLEQFDDKTFYKNFNQRIYEAYVDHFFVKESDDSFLV